MACRGFTWQKQMVSSSDQYFVIYACPPLVSYPPCVMCSQKAAAALTALCWACATSARSAALPPSMPHLSMSAPSAHRKRQRAMCRLWRRRSAAVCSYRTPCRRTHSPADAEECLAAAEVHNAQCQS